MQIFDAFIFGAASTKNFLEVKSPFDGSIVGKAEKASPASLEKALENAAHCFHTHMKFMPAHERARILYEVSDLVLKNQETLAAGIALEGGKPLKDSRREVARAAVTLRTAGDAAKELRGEEIRMDRAPGSETHIAYTTRVPRGPVLAISAFNHPLNLICHQVGTAVAAGNSVVVKPASQTPLSCLRLAAYFKQAGLPEGVLNVVVCSGQEAEALVKDSRIRYVSFIGGEDVGWNIQKKVHPGVRVALELGGTASSIVHKDADLENAIPSIVKGAFYHAGQVCVSTQNLFVHQDIFDNVLAKLCAQTEKLVVGDPSNAETDVGPLISKEDVARVDALVQDALHGGAKLLTGGKRLSNNCYAPTILAGIRPDMRIASSEVFGPVLAVEPYSDLHVVVERLNRSRYSFQTSIFTQSLDAAHRAGKLIDCTAFLINESTAFRVDWMPFGGSKESGLGVGGVTYSMLEQTEEKLIVTKVKNVF